MGRVKQYTEEQFIEAVRTSGSIRQVLNKIGLVAAGGNYASCKRYMQKLNLDTSHFHGQAWNKGKTLGHKKTISQYLSNEHAITSHRLRLRLVEEGYFDHVCSSCKRKKWMKKLIPLELDHIDGNHDDNSLSNLRLLCPNCHAQTSTYRGKNKKSFAIRE